MAVVLEVARTLARRPQRLRRTVLFIFFTGEEWGFWGSSYYVNNPVVPLEKTVAMVNLDMVGRLREDALTVNSVGTGTGFGALLDQINRSYGFRLTKVAGASGRSDQASFYAKRIPNIHFFTGKHPDYHEPTDTFPGEHSRDAADCRLRGGDDGGLGQCPRSGREFVAVPHAAAGRRHAAAFSGLRARLHPRGAGLSDQRA